VLPFDPFFRPLRALGGAPRGTIQNLVGLPFAYVCDMLTFICDVFTLVGQRFALVCDPFTVIRHGFAAISDAGSQR
jgi:hypothetical protein